MTMVASINLDVFNVFECIILLSVFTNVLIKIYIQNKYTTTNKVIEYN